MPITPFSVSPMPSHLHLTPSLKASLHKFNYVIANRQGLGLLLADTGHGKTSLLRRLAADLEADVNTECVFIADPETASAMAFIQNICKLLDIKPKRSLADQKEALQLYIQEKTEQGKNFVLLLDEAQEFGNDILKLLRALNNFEVDTAKLCQIILAGQLNLREKLNKMRAIKSRVVMQSLLNSFSLQELNEVLHYRCELHGIAFPFTDEAVNAIFDFTAGVPREALTICADTYALMALRKLKIAGVELVALAIEDKKEVYDE